MLNIIHFKFSVAMASAFVQGYRGYLLVALAKYLDLKTQNLHTIHKLSKFGCVFFCLKTSLMPSCTKPLLASPSSTVQSCIKMGTTKLLECFPELA